VIFALTGEPPFGDDDPKAILARQLGEGADLKTIPTALCNWFRTAFAPEPSKRFADGEEMRSAWKAATAKVLARERGGWWRRVIT
jgi:hypothetical protein